MSDTEVCRNSDNLGIRSAILYLNITVQYVLAFWLLIHP